MSDGICRLLPLGRGNWVYPYGKINLRGYGKTVYFVIANNFSGLNPWKKDGTPYGFCEALPREGW